MTASSDARFTGEHDKNDNRVYEGMKLKGKNYDGEETIFTVAWSDFHRCWVAEHPHEAYDIAPSMFYRYEIVPEEDRK